MHRYRILSNACAAASGERILTDVVVKEKNLSRDNQVVAVSHMRRWTWFSLCLCLL